MSYASFFDLANVSALRCVDVALLPDFGYGRLDSQRVASRWPYSEHLNTIGARDRTRLAQLVVPSG
jgi:hypothetical protein